MAFTQGVSSQGPFVIAGAPASATDERQTLTTSGTSTAGTFRLSFQGEQTTTIPWNATTAQTETALNTLVVIASGGTAAVGVAVTGGPFPGTALTVTFSGSNFALVDGTPLLVLANNSLTGGGTVVIARTATATLGTHRGALPGALLVRTNAGNVNLYQNTGSSLKPSWSTR